MTEGAPYRSGEILNDNLAPTGLFGLFGTPACAVFDDKLWIVGSWFTAEDPSAYGSLYQTTLALRDPSHAGQTIDIENDAGASASLWSTEQIVVEDDPEGIVRVDIGWRDPMFTMTDNVAPSSFGLAAVGDKLVLCWNARRDSEGADPGDPPNSAVRAAIYSRDDNSLPAWRSAVSLLDDQGNGLVTASTTSDVAAVAFGTDYVIVACSAAAPTADEPNGRLYVGWYRPADIDEKAKTWKAANGRYVAEAVDAIWIDWFSGSASPSGSSDDPVQGPPSFELWVSAMPADQPDTSISTLLIPFDEDGRILSVGLLYSSTTPGTIVRDPAGRIARYEGRAGEIGLRTYHTATAPDAAEPFQSHDLALGASSAQDPTVNVSAGHPGVAYFTDRTRGATVTCDGRTGTGYPIYEFLCYGPCQVRRYGTAEVYPDFEKDISLVPKVPNTIVIAGIVDGPIPIPNANVADIDFADTEPTFATVQYGMTNAKEKEHSVKNSWTVGFKTEGEATKGFGPAWDISLSGGTASTQADRSTESIADMRAAPTILDDETRNKRGQQAVLPVGHVFGAAATFSWTAFRFVDADGSIAADGALGGPSQAPLYATMSCQFNSSDTYTYLPYAVHPGDLSSYTPEGWTTRMKELGWGGDDYVREIIVPNAADLKGKNFLRFSLDNGGGTDTEDYELITGQFTETGWSVDSETYVGISGGEGVSVFGLGEDVSFKFLVGGTYSHDAGDSEKNDRGVTVGLTDEGIRLARARAAPSVVKNYRFRLYYLPPPGPSSDLPPNYWVTELKTYLPRGPQGPDQLDHGRIDAEARAWKIVFVVDHYECYGGKVYNSPGGF